MKKRIGIFLCALLAGVCLLLGACTDKSNISTYKETPTVKIALYETLDGEEKLCEELNVYISCYGLETGNMFFGYYETGEIPKRQNYVFKGIYDKPNGAGQCLISETGHSEITFYLGKDYKGYIYFKEENFDEPTVITAVDTEDAYFLEEMPESIAQGAQITLPIPYITGKQFVGWFFVDNNKRLTDGEGNLLEPWNVHLYDAEIKPGYTTSDITYIVNEEQFAEIANASGGAYALLENLDFTGKTWTPFDFSGTLEGNGKTVQGISVTGAGNLGVFYTLTGTVKNLKLEGLSVASASVTAVNVGGLCAVLSGTVENVEIYGEVIGDYCNAGAIAGVMNGGSVTYCKNYASVSTPTFEDSATCGGLVGLLTTGEILDCENYGDVSGYDNVGGVIGKALPDGQMKTRRLLNCAEVEGRGSCVGGVIGAFIANNYIITTSEYENQGSVAGKDCVGGIFGKIYCTLAYASDDTHSNEFAKLVNSGAVTGVNLVGGCVGELFLMGYEYYGRKPKMEFKGTDFINSGAITGTSRVGGLIGKGYAQVTSSKLVRSSSSGAVTAEHTVGGLAGELQNIGLLACSNEGASVTATGYEIENDQFYVRLGGFLGSGYAAEDCHNQADLTYELKGGCVGGIAGTANGNLTNCSNSGDINVQLASWVGGIAGYIEVAYEYVGTALTNSGSVTGYKYVGGVIGCFIDKMGVNSSDTYTAKFLTLTNTGDVTAGSYSGGLIGFIQTEGTPQYGHNAKMKVVLTNVKCSANVVALGEATGALLGFVDTDSAESLVDAYSFEGTFNDSETDINLIGGYAIIDDSPCIRWV